MLRIKNNNNRWAMIYQSFFKLFITSSIIELGNIVASIIDGLIVSNFYDSNALAAVGIATPMFFITCIVSGLFAGGMQTMCSRELGKGNIKSFNRIFSTIFYISTSISLLFFIVEFAFSRQLAILFGAEGECAELTDITMQYIRGLAIGFPGLVLVVLVSVGCILDNDRKRTSNAVLVYVIFNSVFDIILIKLKLGIFGIGLATSIGVYIELGYLLLHFRIKGRMLHFTKPYTNLKEIFRIISFGTEKVIRYTLNIISLIIVNKLIIYYGGTLAMSAMTVRNSVDDFADIMALALADAVSLQIGVFYGEKNSDAIRETGKYAHKCCALFLGSMSVVVLLFSKIITTFYISDRGELFNMSVFAVCVTAILQPLNALVRARISYLQAINKAKNMRILSFLSFFGYLVLSAVILGKLFGAYGILSSFLLALLLSIITVWIYYAIINKKISPTVDDYLALPKDFYFRNDDIISIDIRNIEDISIVTEKIQLFCKDHNVNSKIGMKVALCFEELADNIIKFGFSKCKKQPCIDLRIVFLKEEIIMRLRDNCPMFDIERYIAQKINLSENKVETNLGLKIISNLAEKISYVHSLETNNVILHFTIKDSQ